MTARATVEKCSSSLLYQIVSSIPHCPSHIPSQPHRSHVLPACPVDWLDHSLNHGACSEHQFWLYQDQQRYRQVLRSWSQWFAFRIVLCANCVRHHDHLIKSTSNTRTLPRSIWEQTKPRTRDNLVDCLGETVWEAHPWILSQVGHQYRNWKVRLHDQQHLYYCKLSSSVLPN